MIVTINWIEKKYNQFNDLYFGGTLPTVKFKINRSKNSWGFASFIFDWENDTVIPECITMSNYYDSPENVKIQTLLHEMIHIEDYLWHPEHFIKNHRRVSSRQYDAHGEWFMNEAKRITEESGYKIDKRVTDEEMSVSNISKSVKRNLENRKNTALICAVTGTNGVIFYFKTDIYKVSYLKSILKTMKWYRFEEVKSIKFYTFDDPYLAEMRSCTKSIKGWHTDRFGFFNKMKDIKATEVHF